MPKFLVLIEVEVDVTSDSTDQAQVENAAWWVVSGRLWSLDEAIEDVVDVPAIITVRNPKVVDLRPRKES